MQNTLDMPTRTAARRTTTGTAAIQGELWGARARDWAEINEPAWGDVFATAMDKAGELVLVSAVYRVFFLEEDLAAYRRHMRTMRDNAAQPAPAMLDGFEVLKRLRRDRRTEAIPVIMLTTRKHDHQVLAALAVGAQDYLAKPFLPEQLVRRVGKLLASSGRPFA